MVLDTSNLINDLIRWKEHYIEHIKSLKYSNNTIMLYNRVLESFIEYSREFQEEITLKEIKTFYITGFLTYLDKQSLERTKRTLSKSSKATYIKALKNFFIYISDNNDEFFTFERYFRNLKVADSSKAQEKIQYLREDDIDKLINQLEREKSKKGTYKVYRNSFLIKLMLYAGLRISEALKVKLSDFRESENQNLYKIRIEAKGGKIQDAYISKDIISDELYYFRNIAKKRDDDFLMVSGRGNLMSREGAYKVVNNIYRRAGIYKRGLHILRHTLAMRLTKQNESPFLIKKVLRHNNINTTTIYAKVEEGDLGDALGFR